MSKWFLEVVQSVDGTYYANMTIDGVVVRGLPYNVDYNTLKDAIREKTGIEILKRKDMIFQQDHNKKKYAYIDATQERKDCRVTLDEMYNGWRPKFDLVWISVYKDALGHPDDNDNLTEILVPEEWLKNKLLADDVTSFAEWSAEYTADQTIDIARMAIEEKVVLGCMDESISFEESVDVFQDNDRKTIYERAAEFVDGALAVPDGKDLFFISNIYYMLTQSDCEPQLTRSELLKLTERLTEAAMASSVPLLTAERVDAVRALLERGIEENRSAEFSPATPEQAKKVLLECDLEVFINLVDQVALDNQEFYAPDGCLTADELGMIEKAFSAAANDKPALEDVIKSAEQKVVAKTNFTDEPVSER